MIKKLIGKWTQPKGMCFYISTSGEVSYWIPVYGVPRVNWETGGYELTSHPYNYREVKQDWKGAWVEANSWWGKNEALVEIVNEK